MSASKCVGTESVATGNSPNPPASTSSWVMQASGQVTLQFIDRDGGGLFPAAYTLADGGTIAGWPVSAGQIQITSGTALMFYF